jgi:hypothetical protein
MLVTIFFVAHPHSPMDGYHFFCSCQFSYASFLWWGKVIFFGEKRLKDEEVEDMLIALL